jgi:CheY-like chemotaxis protein
VAEASRHRILVVDDNQDGARSLSRLLELQGHECRVAFNGPAAIDLAARFRPDVFLLDIGMPEMSGYEVARRIRALPEHRGATLIAITGWGQEEDRRRSREAGFDLHLVKPITIDALAGVLGGGNGRSPEALAVETTNQSV